MPVRHRLLAALVAVLWGLNFLAIHASLVQFPPFFLVALRWTVLAVPTLLLVPRPRVPLRHLVLYGTGFGLLQFLFLYWGMASGMPTGLASLVLQSSAPFTVLLGALVTREQLSRWGALGVGVAVLGLAVVGSQRMTGAAWWPFALTLLAGLSWAVGNLASRAARPEKPLHLALWMTVVPPVPMLALSFAVEGPDAVVESLRTAPGAPLALLGLAYTAVVATVLGSGIWTWLMKRHPASTVAPWSMLVPVVGLSSAWAVLDERPNAVEWLGCAVVVSGVLLTARRPGGRPGRRRTEPVVREYVAASPRA